MSQYRLFSWPWACYFFRFLFDSILDRLWLRKDRHCPFPQLDPDIERASQESLEDFLPRKFVPIADHYLISPVFPRHVTRATYDICQIGGWVVKYRYIRSLTFWRLSYLLELLPSNIAVIKSWLQPEDPSFDKPAVIVTRKSPRLW